MRKTLLKYLFLLFLQVLFPVALHSQFRPGAFDNLTDSETVRALKGHVGTIASTMMEGRAAGSEGERLAAESSAAMASTCSAERTETFSGSVRRAATLFGPGTSALS